MLKAFLYDLTTWPTWLKKSINFVTVQEYHLVLVILNFYTLWDTLVFLFDTNLKSNKVHLFPDFLLLLYSKHWGERKEENSSDSNKLRKRKNVRTCHMSVLFWNCKHIYIYKYIYIVFGMSNNSISPNITITIHSICTMWVTSILPFDKVLFKLKAKMQHCDCVITIEYFVVENI